MLGIYGTFTADRERPVDIADMAATVPSSFADERTEGAGCALGVTGHRHGVGFSHWREGSYIAVAVGEIFNVPELLDGVVEPPDNGLAAVLVELEKAGRLDRLAEANGLFSAAIYKREAHRLTLVTDRLATFPLHMWRQDGEVSFAGQIYTLLGDARIARKADPGALAQLFTMQRTVGTVTPIEGVEALPAATIRVIGPGGIEDRRYWRLVWKKTDFGLRDGAVELATALEAALQRQTSGEGNGLLLSGGVDSRIVLGAAPTGSLSCWTTASYEANPELAMAGQIAEMLGAKREPLVVAPEDTLPVLDQTVIDSNGMYPASTPMSTFLPKVAEKCTSILTGHGIDYTLRGYYLPSKFISILGSRTRYPALRSVAKRPTGADVLANLRQGPPRQTLERIVAPSKREFWWSSQGDAMDETLAPWLQDGDPYNAWDAFILHAVSKHYAFTSMMAVRAVGNLRIPAFDNDVFDVYLRMPPAWRCSGRMVQLAMRLLSPALARIPNANTHFRADLNPTLEVAALLGRAALRRMRILKRPMVPTEMHSVGSWQDLGALLRDGPRHRQRLTEIRGRLDALSGILLNPDAVALCIDEHLEGSRSHTKLLRQLLTHDAWVRCFGVTAIG